MPPKDQKPVQTPSTGYGKRPLWQWIILYIIIGVIVYGLIYLIFFQKSGVSGGY